MIRNGTPPVQQQQQQQQQKGFLLPYAPSLPIQQGVPYCTLSSDTGTSWSQMKTAWEEVFAFTRDTLLLYTTLNRQKKDTKEVLKRLNDLLSHLSRKLGVQYPGYYIRLFVQNSQGIIRASGSSDPENAPIGESTQWRAEVSNAYAMNIPSFPSSVRGSASVTFKLSYYLAFPVIYDSICGSPPSLILRLSFTVK